MFIDSKEPFLVTIGSKAFFLVSIDCTRILLLERAMRNSR